MLKVLVVVDMQNDFIDPVLGSLGTKEACEAVDKVVELIKKEPYDKVYATMDTHGANYLETMEGKNLPVKHCIKGDFGWDLNAKVKAALEEVGYQAFEKDRFGCESLQWELRLLQAMARISEDLDSNRIDGRDLEVVLCGVCTDICVISNALLIKSWFPEATVSVVENACAGVTPEKHAAAIEIMKSCQVQII